MTDAPPNCSPHAQLPCVGTNALRRRKAGYAVFIGFVGLVGFSGLSGLAGFSGFWGFPGFSGLKGFVGSVRLSDGPLGSGFTGGFWTATHGPFAQIGFPCAKMHLGSNGPEGLTWRGVIVLDTSPAAGVACAATVVVVQAVPTNTATAAVRIIEPRTRDAVTLLICRSLPAHLV